jgi:acylphosphatase
VADETLHLLVKGRVQGVGFRWYVLNEARRLGLSGWVRNNDDGSVEVCARGPSDSVRSLESHVTRGPDGARVSDVERVAGKTDGNLTKPFSIARD